MLFLDTEFTNFTYPELIAIGLVSEDGREFYAESSDFDHSKCSDFVKKNVLPRLIGTSVVVKGSADLRASLATWLQQFRSANTTYVAFDYRGDWTLMCTALGEWPAWLHPIDVGDVLAAMLPERVLMAADSPQAHNALADARALRADWIAANVHPLPLDHREQKTRRQQEFLRSDHPGTYGIWDDANLKTVHIPSLDR